MSIWMLRCTKICLGVTASGVQGKNLPVVVFYFYFFVKFRSTFANPLKCPGSNNRSEEF